MGHTRDKTWDTAVRPTAVWDTAVTAVYGSSPLHCATPALNRLRSATMSSDTETSFFTTLAGNRLQVDGGRGGGGCIG